MLKELRKEFNKVFCSNNVKEVEMVEEQGQPELAAVEQTVELASQASTLVTLKADYENMTANFKELSTKYAEAIAKLAELESAKASLVAEAAAAKLAARKEKLQLAVGDVKADSLLTTLEGLDDSSFDTVVEAMTTNLDKEANSSAFVEKGVTASADAEKVVEAGSIKAKLEKKYKSN